MISFVVPAHNEEKHLGTTLATLFAAARAVGEPFEVIVVNDASTDQPPSAGMTRTSAIGQTPSATPEIAAARTVV